METREIRNRYVHSFPLYQKLGKNIKEALEMFLQEQGISFVQVYHRVKTFPSFLEKMERRNYQDPFGQMHDLCGVRIICYFQSDVKRIQEIIKKEFQVVEAFAKEDHFEPTHFGYRSSHSIIKIKKSWLNSPHYRDLEGLQAEIQVRTILMHAWAEIEHKLAYKKQSHIPSQFRRKFSRLSAKLEEVDEQFEELADAIKQEKGDIGKRASEADHFDRKLEVNLDTLQSFLDHYLPGKHKNIRLIRDLLDQFLDNKTTMKDLVDGYEKKKKNIKKGHDVEQTQILRDVLQQE